MSVKQPVLLLITCFILLSASSSMTMAAETRRVLSFSEDGLRVRAYAPYQAYLGDDIEVRVTAEALEDLNDIYLTIDIFGSVSEEGKVGYDSWDDYFSVLKGVDWEEGDDKDRKYDVEIPKDSDPGLVYGQVTAEWTTVADDEDHTYSEAFTVTYVVNEEFKDLQNEYEDLSEDYEDLLNVHNTFKTDFEDLSSKYDNFQATYNSLKSDYDSLNDAYESLKSNHESLTSSYESLTSSYDSLKSEHNTLVIDYDLLEKKYNSLQSDHNSLTADYDALKLDYEISVGELGTSRSLSYVFLVTTIVFILTSVIFFVRKPKSH